MVKRYLSKATMLINSILLLTLGVFIIVKPGTILNAAARIGGILLTAHGINLLSGLFSGENGKRKTITRIFTAIINIVCGIFSILLPDLTILTFIILFTVYVYLNAAVKLADSVMGSKNIHERQAHDVIAFFFYLAFAVIISFAPSFGISSVPVILGIYCILYGISRLNDFFVRLIPARAAKREPRIRAPILISSFKPQKFIKKSGGDFNSVSNGFTEKKTAEAPDIEVLIQVRAKGGSRMGHCDIVLDGRAISYGNYDSDTFKLGRLFGQGILFTANKDRYISFCTKNQKKSIICYGLKLGALQIERIRNEIAGILNQCYQWKPELQRRHEIGKDAVYSDGLDYCSKLWYAADGRFYKFHSGTFKSYFALSRNCVLLAAHILRQVGGGLDKYGVILTPGKLFEYLERLFDIKDSIVISRTIYNGSNTELRRLYGEDN